MVSELKDTIVHYTQRKDKQEWEHRDIVDSQKVDEHMQTMEFKKNYKVVNRTPNKRIKIKALERDIKIQDMNKSLDLPFQIGIK